MRAYNGISKGFTNEPKFTKFSKFLNVTKSTEIYLSSENKCVRFRESLKIRKADAKLKFRTMRKRSYWFKKELLHTFKKKNPTVHGKSKLQLEECQLVTEHRKGENLLN